MKIVPELKNDLCSNENIRQLVVAGGCFWGVQLMF
jgi:hypothetical protein